MKTSEYEASTLKVVHSIIALPLSLIKRADYLAVTGKEVSLHGESHDISSTDRKTDAHIWDVLRGS